MTKKIDGAKGCFRENTRILTPTGYGNIQDFKVGDAVLCYDDNGNTVIGHVTETFNHDTSVTKDEFLKITHEKGSLYITENHWVLIDGNKYKEIGEFNIGDCLYNTFGRKVKIIDIEKCERYERSYNLSVSPNRTFFAGGIRVHNKGGGKSSSPPPESPNTLQSVAYVKVVDLVSEGEIEGLVHGDGRDIIFDETPVSSDGTGENFHDIYTEGRPGLVDQEYLPTEFIATVSGTPGTAGNIIDVSTEVTIAGGTITRTITNSEVDAVKLLFTIPALVKYKDDGGIVGTTVKLRVYVQANGGGYAEVRDVLFDGKNTQPYQRTIIIENLSTYGDSPWDIQVERITDDSESSKLSNKTYWSNYVELQYEKFYYPYSAIMAVEIRADQFSGVPTRKYHVKGIKCRVPSNYDESTRVYTGVWDGTFKAARVYTNNPAWELLEILTNKRYGYPYTDAQIDLGSLYQAGVYNDGFVDDFCGGTEPRFTLNTQIGAATSGYNLLNMMCSNMRVKMFEIGGILYFAQDRPGDVVINVSNTDVINGMFNYSSSRGRDRYNQIQVTWNDPDDNYRQTIEYASDSDDIRTSGRVNSKSTVAFGCTSRGQAKRYGSWVIDTELNQTEVVTYTAGIKHSGIVPGDVIAISDQDFSSMRAGGLVVSSTTSSVTIDAPFTIESGETYELRITQPDNTVETYDVTNVVGTHSIIYIDTTFAVEPQVESAWQIIASNLEPREFRVVNIKEVNAGTEYAISGVIYDGDKYDRIETGANFDTPIYTSLPDSNVLTAPTSLAAEEYQTNTGSARQFNVLLSWTHTTDPRRTLYEVQQRLDGYSFNVPPYTTNENYYDIPTVTSGTYYYRVRAIGLTGNSEWITLDNFDVIADTESAVDVTGLQVVGGGTTFNGRDCEFEWDEITLYDEADFKDYKVEILTASGVHQRYLYPKNNYTTYNYNMNLEDNGGIPSRSINVNVWCRDIYDSLSINPAVATFSNPIPDMSSTTPDVTPKAGFLRIEWDIVDDNDMELYEIYVDSTAVATVIHPTVIYDYFDVTYGTDYDIQIKPWDVFGAGTISQIQTSSPLLIPAIDIDVELVNSVSITTDALYSGTIGELYNRTFTTGGITIANPSGKYIQYEYSIENYFDRVGIWSGNANPRIYIAYSTDGTAWNYLKAEADHTLTANSELETASSQADAQTNYFQLASGMNIALFPDNLAATHIRIYFVNSNSTILYEAFPSRILVSELAAIDSLSAYSANIGTITAGTLQSSDYDANTGMIIDLDNKDIEIRYDSSDRFIYDGATGSLAITGVVTFLSGTTGISNTDIGGAGLLDVDEINTSDINNDAGWTDDTTADSKIKTFYQTTAPTAEATGDLWVDTDDGNRMYRWSSSAWVSVRDTTIADAQADASQAISDAATAQGTADGKVTTFYQTGSPTAEGTGDLWIDTDDGNKLYRWSGSAWTEVQDDGIATAISNAATAQSTADGKIVSFYQDAEPTAEGTGDLWTDTNDSNKLYRWSGSAWVSVRDTDIAKALSDASTAQSTADGKILSFYQATAPSSGMSTGDIWVDTDDNNKLYRYSGSAWVDIQDGTISDAQADATQAINDASDAQATADGKVTTYIQDAIPTSEGAGDLWVDSNDDNKLYRAAIAGANEIKAGEWVLVRDSGISQAISDASTAQATADGKIVSFYQDSAPTAEGVGDLWFDTDDNNTPYRWSGSAWVAADNPVADWDLVTGSDKPEDNATVGAPDWEHASDTTKIDGGDIYTNSITAAVVGTTELIANTANIKNGIITSAKIGNAEIKTANINDLAVETVKIKDQAVTIPVSSFTASSTSISSTTSVNVQTASITSTGAPINITASMALHGPSTGYTSGVANVYLYRGTTQLVANENIVLDAVDATSLSSFSYKDTPGSGSQTYYIKARLTTGAPTVYVSNKSLLLLEVKK